MTYHSPRIVKRLVVSRICHVTGYSARELLGRRKTQPLAAIRQLAVCLTRRISGASTVEVARAWNQDHGNVRHADRATQDRLDAKQDEWFCALYDAVETWAVGVIREKGPLRDALKRNMADNIINQLERIAA